MSACFPGARYRLSASIMVSHIHDASRFTVVSCATRRRHFFCQLYGLLYRFFHSLRLLRRIAGVPVHQAPRNPSDLSSGGQNRPFRASKPGAVVKNKKSVRRSSFSSFSWERP